MEGQGRMWEQHRFLLVHVDWKLLSEDLVLSV